MFGATFFIFSEYMRPAVRLAALMGQPVTYVWTHDSIGVGEDGPTHQPIEQLMALRMIPNLTIIRPADANETVARLADGGRGQDRPGGPGADPPEAAGPGCRQGPRAPCAAATSWRRPAPRPGVILVGTGSEVHLALAARTVLEGEGIPTRVVSLPSWEVFQAQPASYRQEVLPPAVKARVAVEAGVTFGWERWVGDAGAVVGVDHFGASAPAEVLFEQFGFTVANLVATAKRVLG